MVREFLTLRKDSQQRPGGRDQSKHISKWKWEMINENFIIGLPRSHRKHDSNWVVVDGITKSSNVLPVKATHFVEDYLKLCIQEVVRLIRLPILIIPYRGALLVQMSFESHPREVEDIAESSQILH